MASERACLTFAVSIVVHLDFGPSEAGIPMQLAVVEVGLAVAATHRPLVRFALLKQSWVLVQSRVPTHTQSMHTRAHRAMS